MRRTSTWLAAFVSVSALAVTLAAHPHFNKTVVV
ncbi:MAG: hypothetical protein H6Q32_1184, partial [Bacteroidetes bacterium]|nr:hypothetical protein [Bacteroidota bacterium]